MFIWSFIEFVSNTFFSRESEGSFAYGNYWREADDLRAVVEHFSGANRVVSVILGHSKGVYDHSRHTTHSMSSK